jgi:hypothetical protein
VGRGEGRRALFDVGGEASEVGGGGGMRDGMRDMGEARRKTTRDRGEWKWKKYVLLRSLRPACVVAHFWNANVTCQMQNVRSTKTPPDPGPTSQPPSLPRSSQRARHGLCGWVPRQILYTLTRALPLASRIPLAVFASTAVADRHPTHLGLPPPPPSDQLAGASARVPPPPYVRQPPRQPGPPAPHPSPPRCRRGRPRRGHAAPLALVEAGRSRRRLAARGRRRGSTSR